MSIDKLRFGARRGDGRRSALWVAFTSGSDVYVGVRSIAGRLKLSLHADGNCHIAVDHHYYRRLAEAGLPLPPERHFVRWRMPELPGRGTVHVASVVFPSRFLKDRGPIQMNKPVFLEPAPDQGALEVGFFYGRSAPAGFVPGVRPRFVTRLSDGRMVIAVTRHTDFDEQRILRPLLGQHKLHALSRELWEAQPGNEIADCDAFLWNDVKDGQAVCIWEIAGVNIRRDL